MIERYTRDEMGHIWDMQNKFDIWREIEVLACEAQAELGECGITVEDAAWIRAHAAADANRIAEIEKTTNHDVIAFTTNMAENIDAEIPAGAEKPSRWVHYGMTSSDLGDTALSYQIVQAIDIIIKDTERLMATCKERAFELRDVLCVGRTHGIHAEPMTFGMKFGSWAWALKRCLVRMQQAREVAAVGAISGAVGTYSSINPFVEQYVCEKLGLVPDPLSTQVLARDRHAQVASALAVCASTLESIAMQVRLLQQSDVIEAEEPFTRGQKGSSAMPHKRNPITAERVCGMARLVKANAQVAYDDVALWYERDISHSSAERVALADSFIALDYMFGKMQWMLDVEPELVSFYLDKSHLLIITEGTLTQDKLNELAVENHISGLDCGRCLFYILNQVMSKDLNWLTYVEDMMEDIEEEILNDVNEVTTKTIIKLRRIATKQGSFYQEIGDIAEVLANDASDIVSTAASRRFQNLSDHCDRLSSRTDALKEYSMQLHELYQTQLDEKQNKIMEIFTIVTVVIAPLSFLTGWFGMNIPIPGLQFQYMWIILLVAAVIITAGIVVFIRRKKWL